MRLTYSVDVNIVHFHCFAYKEKSRPDKQGKREGGKGELVGTKVQIQSNLGFLNCVS